MNRNLKKQILFLLIFFTITVTIIIGALSIINIYNSKIDIIKHNQNLVLKQVLYEIDSQLKKIEKVSLYISENYFLNENILKNIVEVKSDISTIMVLNKAGLVEDLYTNSQINQNIYKGFDFSNKEYFKRLKNNNSYWSNVFLSSFDEKPTISYSFVMGDKIGVILIDIKEISDFIFSFKNQDGSNMIRVFDKNAIMIMNPDHINYVLQRYNASSSPVYTELINKHQPFEYTLFYSSIDKQKQLGTYVTSIESGWNIVVRENYSNILETLNSVFLSVVITILIFTILAIYLALKISRRVFKSFDDIENITSNIAKGNYDIKLKDLYYDEFNRVLNSFNKMQMQIDKREENLEKSLNSFKSLFNSTMESIVLHKENVVIDVNDVCLELLKLDSKDLIIGKSIYSYISPEYKELVESNYEKNTGPYEIELINSEGKRINTLVQGKFIDLQGRKVKISSVIDITELKHKDNLLFQQSKMAAMGEMIGNIAHQWRQPLSVISTCASGVKFEKEYGELKDERFIESMDVILENSQYLSRTIDDFRNFFNTEKVAEDFVVKNIIKRALKLLSSTLKNYEIDLHTQFLEEEFRYEGFPNEFIQVFINLINNSKDAFLLNDIKNRYIEVLEHKYEDKYILEIRDNAGGIPENIINKIFDPYFTTKHKAQGTGIGLYMSHQIIVDHMHGEISVKNVNIFVHDKVQKGSCFRIEFPLNKLS
ncbi:MAG: ATP-binding protein [Halarcobacter sp.]